MWKRSVNIKVGESSIDEENIMEELRVEAERERQRQMENHVLPLGLMLIGLRR